MHFLGSLLLRIPLVALDVGLSGCKSTNFSLSTNLGNTTATPIVSPAAPYMAQNMEQCWRKYMRRKKPDTDTGPRHLKEIEGMQKSEQFIPRSFRLAGRYRPNFEQRSVPGCLGMGGAHVEAIRETTREWPHRMENCAAPKRAELISTLAHTQQIRQLIPVQRSIKDMGVFASMLAFQVDVALAHMKPWLGVPASR